MIINLKNINKALDLLCSGELVAFPTETVYGLGADASNVHAIKKIFLAKERPINHPLIVHIANIEQLSTWAQDIPESAYVLAKEFWPGPITMILRKHKLVNPLLTADQDLIALRIPSHPIALALLKAFNGGIAGPSANKFCRISPTNEAAVQEELGNKVSYIIPGGNCQIGIESTIVDLSSDEPPVILRPGMITAEQISAVLRTNVVYRSGSNNTTISAGMHKIHYAPQTPVVLLNLDNLTTYLAQQSLPEAKYAVLSTDPLPTLSTQVSEVIMPTTASSYARILYRTLRELDKHNFHKIIIIAPPTTTEWTGIYDRITRASNNIIAPEIR